MTASADAPHRAYRFGVFEVDPRSGEIRKRGIRQHLQGKPFQVLLALLERPGEVVTREELQRRLWSSDVFVDFENGLNTAINRLRLTLGDSAEHPRYVETLARTGYRFIAPVHATAPETAPTPGPPRELADAATLGGHPSMGRTPGETRETATTPLQLGRRQLHRRIFRQQDWLISGRASSRMVGDYWTRPRSQTAPSGCTCSI
ncbi:MAG: hypothetical protein FJW27_09465 [Acidimicrobiia bacterium]|nr:hypothetical protein [Acidimicrobiia bacterium]